MKKLFISQPMRGKTEAAILKEREAIFIRAQSIIGEHTSIRDTGELQRDLSFEVDMASKTVTIAPIPSERTQTKVMFHRATNHHYRNKDRVGISNEMTLSSDIFR